MATSELLTLSEASALLRIRVSTLRAWRTQRSKLPFVKLGGRVFVRRSDAEALIARSIVPAREVSQLNVSVGEG
jgi:excisionase family DNA binding protein